MKIDINENQKPVNQNEEILYHLKFVGVLTSMSAIKYYGITRLSSRVHELKKDGWDIRSETIRFKTRHGRNAHYNEYYLIRK